LSGAGAPWSLCIPVFAKPLSNCAGPNVIGHLVYWLMCKTTVYRP
jgi:hypothetical protein